MKTKNMPKWKTPMITFGIFFVFILALFLKYCYLALFPNIYGIDMEEFAESRNMYKSTLYASRGNKISVDAKSLMGMFSIDPSSPFDVEYDDGNVEFDEFVSQFEQIYTFDCEAEIYE